MPPMNRTSRLTTEGISRAPNRGLLRAVGFHDDDFSRPMIGVASLYSTITPCNAHLDRLARAACEGIRAAGGVGQVFGAPTASDGIMMGHQGMRYSLVSREVIADSLEVVPGRMNHDGLLAVGGCGPCDIMAREALENAYTAGLALGGSTSAVRHLMAMAREAGGDGTLADVDRLGVRVPDLAEIKPAGRYVMYDLHRAGGTPA